MMRDSDERAYLRIVGRFLCDVLVMLLCFSLAILIVFG